MIADGLVGGFACRPGLFLETAAGLPGLSECLTETLANVKRFFAKGFPRILKELLGIAHDAFKISYNSLGVPCICGHNDPFVRVVFYGDLSPSKLKGVPARARGFELVTPWKPRLLFINSS